METCYQVFNPFSGPNLIITDLLVRIVIYINQLFHLPYLFLTVLTGARIIISSLPLFFIGSILVIIFHKQEIISLKKIYLFSFIIATILVLSTTGSCYFILKQEAERKLQLRKEVENVGVHISKSISSKVTGEELINDPNFNNKYKLLRINVVITVPEAATYSIQTSLNALTERGNPAMSAYINGKDYIYQGENNINLNEGENTVTFDFPYLYYNDYHKVEAVSLPFNDTPNGNYGPYKFTFTLLPVNSGDFAQKAKALNADPRSAEYDAKPYQTKAYKYMDFYQ